MDSPREPLRDITSESLGEITDASGSRSLLPATRSSLEISPLDITMDIPINDQRDSCRRQGFAIYSEEDYEEVWRGKREPQKKDNFLLGDEPIPRSPDIGDLFARANATADSVSARSVTEEPAAMLSLTNESSPDNDSFAWSPAENVTKDCAVLGSVKPKRSADVETFSWADIEPPKIPRIKKYLSTGDNRNDGVDVLHFGANNKKGNLLYTRFDSYPQPPATAARGFDPNNDLSTNPYAKALFTDPMRLINVAKSPYENSTPATISPNRLHTTASPSTFNNKITPVKLPPQPTNLSTSPCESRASRQTTSNSMPAPVRNIPLSPSDISALQTRHYFLRMKYIIYDDTIRRIGIRILDRNTRSKIRRTVNRSPNHTTDSRILAKIKAQRQTSEDQSKSTGAAPPTATAEFLEQQDLVWEKALMQELLARKTDWFYERAMEVERMLSEAGVAVEKSVERIRERAKGKPGSEKTWVTEEMSAKEILKVLAECENLKVAEEVDEMDETDNAEEEEGQ